MLGNDEVLDLSSSNDSNLAKVDFMIAKEIIKKDPWISPLSLSTE